MKIKFTPTYDETTIDISIEELARKAFFDGSLIGLFRKSVTVYNVIPETEVSKRQFVRNVVNNCVSQSGINTRADGTIEKIINGQTIATKDLDRYVHAIKYYNMPENQRKEYYTFAVGDFVIPDEVDDVVEDVQQWQQLQKKYADYGFRIQTINESINGLAVDTVQVSNI